MPAAWPATLSQVLDADNFAYAFGKTTVRTENQNGAVKVRRRFTRSINPLQGSIVLAASLWSDFRTFYDTTINGGADEFTMIHPITGETATFRFVEEPQVKHKGGINITLFLSLEEMP